MTSSCVFCDKIDNDPESLVYVDRVYPVVAFRPRTGVTKGHLLVVPKLHVMDAAECPEVTAYTMLVAAKLTASWAPANIITSIGGAAMQRVYHLHVHIVPRQEGDGLKLPWSP